MYIHSNCNGLFIFSLNSRLAGIFSVEKSYLSTGLVFQNLTAPGYKMPVLNWQGNCIVVPLKKGIMFLTWGESLSVCVCVCVCVCLSVITFVARWLHSATWCQVRSILSTRTRNYNTCQNDPFPDSDNMDQPDHISFWPITSKVMNRVS